MKLTRYSDYALRVSLYLALHRDRLVSIQEVVETYALPRGNVMKLVTDLVGAGILVSVRGRAGGIRLAQSPKDITVGRVVRHTEGDGPLVDCSNCILAPACGLICIMREAKQAFFGVLDSYSLQDVITKNPEILTFLNRDGAEVPARSSTADR
ncbi:Rrf2 family transcriptional regulator [Seohaeicola saemankumensis]|nr:Rrf2 family transcriptional regulator [Seohaeicola saemankumensis]MCA0872795.1 Rrf2 family transcriptional regulator [Seohaeicola saemankumensis]